MKSNRHHLGIALLAALLSWGSAASADLRENAARMAAVYSNRVEQIQATTREQETDLLRRFIIALVRVEQNHKDNGHLEGLVATAALREDLVSEPHFPEAAEGMPEDLVGLIRTLREHRKTIRDESGKQIRDLNQKYGAALEPLQRELTRQGDLEMALALREIRLGLDSGDPVLAVPTTPLAQAGDPMGYPICLEPPALRERVQLGVRTPSQAVDPVAKGSVTAHAGSWQLQQGSLTLAAASLTTASGMARRNQMFTLEFALRTRNNGQGHLHPVSILYFGRDAESANFQVVQQGHRAFLLLRTTDTPSTKAPFKVELGRLYIDRWQHFVVTYRNGELVVYRNGDEYSRLRREVTGSLSTWADAPLVVGEAMGLEGVPVHWAGRLLFVYLKASIYSQREIRDAFARFSAFVTTMPAEEERPSR